MGYSSVTVVTYGIKLSYSDEDELIKKKLIKYCKGLGWDPEKSEYSNNMFGEIEPTDLENYDSRYKCGDYWPGVYGDGTDGRVDDLDGLEPDADYDGFERILGINLGDSLDEGDIVDLITKVDPKAIKTFEKYCLPAATHCGIDDREIKVHVITQIW